MSRLSELMTAARVREWMERELDPNAAESFDRWEGRMLEYWTELEQYPLVDAVPDDLVLTTVYTFSRGLITYDEARDELAGVGWNYLILFGPTCSCGAPAVQCFPYNDIADWRGTGDDLLELWHRRPEGFQFGERLSLDRVIAD